MFKISNKKITNNIFYNLGTLAVLIFGVIIIPAKANAQYGSYYYNNLANYNNQYYYPTPIYYQAPVNNPTPINSGTTTIYSDSTNPNLTSTTTAPKTIAKAKTTSAKNTDTGSSLAAGVIFGSNSFMPSSLIQWIFFAILVLLVVMLVRKVFKAEENYHSTPMKHD